MSAPSYRPPVPSYRPVERPPAYRPRLPQPLDHRRYPLKDRRIKQMTMCAAAIVETESWIVTISDTKIGGIISSDGCTIKMEPLAKGWVAMFSADDITQCLSIIRRAAEHFEGRANTLKNARTVFKRAFQQHLIEMKTDAILSHYDLTMDTFKKTGRKMLGASVFDALCTKLEQVTTNCEFLVYGHDEVGHAHIFTVSDPGSDSVCDKPGFACIGSGKYAADVMLQYFGQSVYKGVEETVFNLCAAKFMAERSNGVGEQTFLYCRRPGLEGFRYGGGLLEGIRNAWNTEGAPRTPKGIIDFIRTLNPKCT